MRSFIVAFFVAAACATASADNIGIPLNDLGPRPYRLGHIGGLYEDGSNAYPADHLAAGLAISQRIQPLDENGNPSPHGKIGIIAIGNGDTDRVICSSFVAVDCEPGSFTSMVRNNPRVDPAVVVVNGAYEDFTVRESDLPPVLDRIRDYELPRAGVTEQQVQVAWLQLSWNRPSIDIDCACGDDWNLKLVTGGALRALRARYPNLKTAYLSDREYAGYDASPWNSEPFAYDTGIIVRFLISFQMEQVRTNTVTSDARTGPISYTKNQAPWIAWGPYMWANGATPRSDGLTWLPEDYDGPLLSEKGAHKAANLLLDFFMNDPTTRMWFTAAGTPVRARAVRH